MLRGRAFLVILLVLMLPLASIMSGCGGGGGAAIKEVNLQPGGMQEVFSLYYPVPFDAAGHLPAYQVSPGLSNVAGIAGVSLPAGAPSELAQKGFYITAGSEEQISDVYQKMPAAKFITVDAVVAACRVLDEYTMLFLEKEMLADDLKSLVSSLFATMQGMYQGTQGSVRDAALNDLGFLGVAAMLLGLDANIPSEVAGAVDKELSLISAHKARAVSPLFSSQADYSIYAPEGHYQGDLEGYFQALTWMSQGYFSPRPGATPSETTRGRNSTRQALLLVAALHGTIVSGRQALKVWDQIYQPTCFLNGVTNELNVYTYGKVAVDKYGSNLQLSRLGDDSLIDSFIESVLQQASLGGLDDAQDVSGGSFTLFAPRPKADAKIFGELVDPAVPDRTMPRGLDVPAAYGSDRALEILDKQYKDTQYESYEANLRGLRRESSLNPLQTHSSVYSSTISALRVLLKPAPEGYPAFMRNTSWQDKDIYSFLAGWTELEKKALDFQENPYAAPDAPGPTSSSSKGYVEPRPEIFALLAATIDTLKRGLSEREMVFKEITDRLELLDRMLLAFKTIAEKELGNQPISSEENTLIAGFGDDFKYLTTFPISDGQDSQSAQLSLLRDLYGDAVNGEVLQAGLGKPNLYYVIVPINGSLTLAIGAGFSYFESVKAVDQKLTDASWRESVNTGQLPPQPAWCTSFLK